jgi:parallel beta-helix repeat protein
VRDNLKDGIYLFSDAVGNTVRDNTVHGNARYGIYAKSPGNIIGDNQLSGNHAADLREGG